jgi:hypothetical protein
MKTTLVLSLLASTLIAMTATGCTSATHAWPSVREARLEAKYDDPATANGTAPRDANKEQEERVNDAPSGGIF